MALIANTALCHGARHLELEALFQGVEQLRLGFLVDAHGAVALHVAVAAHRRQAGAGLADVAAQQLQVDDFLHGRHRMAVLGHAHGPAHDHPLGLAVHARGQLDLGQVRPDCSTICSQGVASTTAR
jgi:hypothetical protein